ncbi:MAG: ABC transporter ATP-binding protein [Tissierellaceae bacterium]|nr:ABC transporter ATP-binding protein [Tissierellaceae bacterium]
MPLLEVQGMSISFRMYEKGLKQHNYNSVNNISLDVDRGEILAIVGSSGSGKSLFAHGIMGILPKNSNMSGKILFDGVELTKDLQDELRGKKIALVPQSISHLDPLMKVGKQVQSTPRNEETKKKQKETFNRYDLCEKSEKLYPHQLSGGMLRRVMVSTAAQEDYDLIIADEPTPGLDLILARRTLKYFREFADKNKAVILITHDIDLAFDVADRIAIFYAGSIVEIAPVSDFHQGVDALRHPYTKALYNALPQNGFIPIKGTQPFGDSRQEGCLYGPRCQNFNESCSGVVPMRKVRDGMVRCNHAT